MAKKSIRQEKNTPTNEPATSETTQPKVKKRVAQESTSSNKWLMIAAVAGVAIFFLIYAMRLDKVVGMFQDDAWYVLLGKAIATGQGYTLINSPTPGISPLYPPAYPFLLSLVFRVSSQFPQNLWLLKSVSIVAMLLAAGACYYYFTRYRNLPNYLALFIAAIVGLSPGLVFMATSSLMSECVFALAQMAALVAVERCVSEKDSGRFWLYALLAAGAVSWAFLTRSMAAGLILAALLYFLKERLFKSAAVFAVSVALLSGSWMLYSRAKAPTPEQRSEINSYIVRPYTEQFWDRVAGHETAGRISLSELPGRVWNNLASIASSDLGGIVTPSFFPSLNQGLAERGEIIQLLLSLLILGLVIAGYVSVVRERMTFAEFALPFSLLIILIWPFPPYRFLLPSLPLLVFYALLGCKLALNFHSKSIQATNPRERWVGTAVVAGVLLALSIYGNLAYLVRKNADVASQRPRWMRVFDSNEEVMKWTAENVSKADGIATHNPALVHLYTGNKTTTFDNPRGNWEQWGKLGIRYLVHISPVRIPEPDANEAKYRIMHRQADLNLRVADFGPADSRLPWESTPSTNTKIN